MPTPVPAPDASLPSGSLPSPSETEPSTNYWPFLIAMASIALLAEMAYSIINLSTIPLYVKYSLGLAKIVGFTLTAFLASEAALNGPMGFLADRLGRRGLMIIGPSISVFTCIATAVLRNPGGSDIDKWPIIIFLLLLRVLDGAGAAALWPAVFASIGDRVPRERQSEAMGTMNSAYMIGIAFGPLIGGSLNDIFAKKFGLAKTDALHYMPSFVAAATCFLISAVIAIIVAPRGKAHPPSAKAVGIGIESEADTAYVDDAPAADVHRAASLAEIATALKRSPMLLILVLVIFLGIGMISPNVKLFSMEFFHVSEGLFGQLLLIPALVVGALSVPLGRLGDIWGKARSIHVGLAICALALWTILVWEHLYVLVALGTLLGIGFVVSFPAYMALISDIGGPEARGGLIGAVRTAQGLGAGIGTIFASALYEKSHQLPFLLASILLTIGFGLSVIFIRHDPDRTGSVVSKEPQH